MTRDALRVREYLGHIVEAIRRKMRRRLRAGIGGSAGESAGADAVEQVEALAGDLQYPGAGMPHELARQVKQAPAHGGDLMALPTLAESGMPVFVSTPIAYRKARKYGPSMGTMRFESRNLGFEDGKRQDPNLPTGTTGRRSTRPTTHSRCRYARSRHPCRAVADPGSWPAHS